MNNEEKYNQVEPVYEKLASGEVLIISKEGNCLTYATNENGEVVFKKVCLLEDG